MQFKLFEAIPVDSKHIPGLDAISNEMLAMHLAFEKAAHGHMEQNKKLFKGLEGLYPELKDWQYTYNHEQHTITLLKKKDGAPV